MPKQEQMNFREFYINEFFDQVRERTKPDYPVQNYQLIDELFNLLSKQEEITEGIGKLAEQQASSELSIFLFDIFNFHLFEVVVNERTRAAKAIALLFMRQYIHQA